jgi:23S rRNA pseudouridine2605 synthase
MTLDNSSAVRLNKHLALQLGVSRREADNLIAKGKVEVNGTKATLGARFMVGDTIAVDQKLLSDNTTYEYIALNKPIGYVCSRKQQGSSPTIYDLLPDKYHCLKPVGRLDRNSSGIILLSNDGDFAYRMTHPQFGKVKIYNIRLDSELAPLHQQMISDHGVQLDDGASQMQLERMGATDRKSWIVTMKEGRNRQIRRTFSALGYTVTKLHRTNFGNYALGDIKPGESKVVDIQ